MEIAPGLPAIVIARRDFGKQAASHLAGAWQRVDTSAPSSARVRRFLLVLLHFRKRYLVCSILNCRCSGLSWFNHMGNQSASPKLPFDLRVHCVVLTSWPSEFTFLRNIFRLAGLRMHHAGSVSEADFLLTVTGSTVLLSDVQFAGGAWQNAMAMLKERHPLVPMLVIADRAEWRSLADLYECGACGVIWKPFDFQATRKQIRTLHDAFKERLAWREETAGQQAPVRWADSKR